MPIVNIGSALGSETICPEMATDKEFAVKLAEELTPRSKQTCAGVSVLRETSPLRSLDSIWMNWLTRTNAPKLRT